MYQALSDKNLKSLKPQSKIYPVTDGEVLYIQIEPSSSKLWYLSFRLNGKRDRIV